MDGRAVSKLLHYQERLARYAAVAQLRANIEHAVVNAQTVANDIDNLLVVYHNMVVDLIADD